MSSNGQLSPAELAPIAQGQLANEAAAAWNAMNVRARALGCELVPNGSKSSYRTLAQQQELYALYLRGGNLAAKPGTSNHGWGHAVDVATHEMRAMVDKIGKPYGWAKDWSDAPSEWWHILYAPGHYSGPDPGPYGIVVPPAPAGTRDMTVTTMADGRLEVFAETETGEILHCWQSRTGDWTGWASMGTPG